MNLIRDVPDVDSGRCPNITEVLQGLRLATRKKTLESLNKALPDPRHTEIIGFTIKEVLIPYEP